MKTDSGQYLPVSWLKFTLLKTHTFPLRSQLSIYHISFWFPWVFFFLIFKTKSLWLSWNWLCKPGWPCLHRDLHDSASQSAGIQGMIQAVVFPLILSSLLSIPCLCSWFMLIILKDFQPSFSLFLLFSLSSPFSTVFSIFLPLLIFLPLHILSVPRILILLVLLFQGNCDVLVLVIT